MLVVHAVIEGTYMCILARPTGQMDTSFILYRLRSYQFSTVDDTACKFGGGATYALYVCVYRATFGCRITLAC
jgi:hypothetical protein